LAEYISDLHQSQLYNFSLTLDYLVADVKYA